MKIKNIFKAFLLTFVILQFAACEREEPMDINTPNSGNGEFRAEIGGESFVASSVRAGITPTGKMVLSGVKPEGEQIKIYIANPEEGEVNFSENVRGTYYAAGEPSRPFLTGNNGRLRIETLNTTDSIISGTFRFKGHRQALDEDGDPLIDEMGIPVMEEVEMTDGYFRMTEFESIQDEDQGDDDDDDDGDDDDNGDPEHEFSAYIGNREFIPSKIIVEDTLISRTAMWRIHARSSGREMIRLDIPKDLEIGTHSMVDMSNGTQLIGIYKPSSGESYASSPGTLEITEIDLEEGFMKGEFSFTAVDPLGNRTTTYDIRRGKFTIRFEGTQGANNLFKAKINGADYEPEAVIIERELLNQYTRVTMKTQVENQILEITFYESIQPGTYSMVQEAERGNEIVGKYVPRAGTSISYYSGDGLFTITSLDRATGVVTGEFSFIATDANQQDQSEYSITEGEFEIRLP